MKNDPTQTVMAQSFSFLSTICLSMTPKQVLFSFNGRIPRRTFWAVIAFLIAIFIVVSMLLYFAILPMMDLVDTDTFPHLVGIAIVLFICLVVIGGYGSILWIAFAINVKRWHDLGYPGGMVFLGLIPVMGFPVILFTGFLPGQPTQNKYGPDPLAILPNIGLPQR